MSSVVMPNGSRPVVICGAGGHARVIADVLFSQGGTARVLGFLDDRTELHGSNMLGRPVLGSVSSWLTQRQPGEADLIVGIGDNRDRERIADQIALAGFRFANAIHPSAQVGTDVRIGHGTVVMANAVINTGAVLGDHVIVNTAATVDHDCEVEDLCHLSPGVNLAGNVTVGRGTHAGIGACAVPGVRIGEWATVGAGATVICDVPPHMTVVGTPAEPIKTRSAAR